MREDYEKQVSDLNNVLSKAKEAYLNISQQFKQSQQQQQQSQQGNNEQLTQLQTENERLKKELLVQRETYEVRHLSFHCFSLMLIVFILDPCCVSVFFLCSY
jgi:uncharacterized protein YgiM (DUF1202 family)